MAMDGAAAAAPGNARMLHTPSSSPMSVPFDSTLRRGQASASAAVACPAAVAPRGVDRCR
jgi:hypothetical protein